MAADYPELGFDLYQTNRLLGGLGQGPSFTVHVTLPSEKSLYFAVRACGPSEFPARVSGNLSNVVAITHLLESSSPQPMIPWLARRVPAANDFRGEMESYVKGESPLWPMVMPTSYRNASTGI